MVNTLKEGDNSLIPLNYTELLQLIINILDQDNNFAKLGGNNQEKLIIDFDKIAEQLSKFDRGSIFGSENEISANMATINFSEQCRQKFPEQIRKIYDLLENKLTLLAQNKNFVKPFLSESYLF